MDAELKNLKIERTARRSGEPSKWATRWIVAGVLLILLLGAWRLLSEKVNAATEVQVQRVVSMNSGSVPQGVVLNATGYIVAAHKIEVALGDSSLPAGPISGGSMATGSVVPAVFAAADNAIATLLNAAIIPSFVSKNWNFRPARYGAWVCPPTARSTPPAQFGFGA